MILVFAGAGASNAVDCKQYPTTVGFFESVPPEIASNPQFTAACEFLSFQDVGINRDIESVLGALSQVRDYSAKSCDTGSFPGWMFVPGTGRLRRFNPNSGFNPDAFLSHFVPEMEAIVKTIDSLKDDINALVYQFYASEPNKSKLKNWITLILELTRISQDVEIFTTNYDVVLENAIREAGLANEFATGRVSDNIKTRLDLTVWNTPDQSFGSNRYRGRLTKLHGSVDWQRDNNGDIIVSSSRYTGDHLNHILLSPGHKGEPADEPFKTFHRYLQSAAQKVRASIFIGYAFRDDFINQILSNLPADLPVYLINPELPPSGLDFLQNARQISEGFSNRSVKACLEMLRQERTL